LLACVLMVSAPHAMHVPLWLSGLAAALLVWRAHLSYSGIALPPRWLLLLITAGCVAALYNTFHTVFGREVGVTMLILLAALKMLELRTRRDAMLVIFLCCFVVITNFFYSQSPSTALFMLATLLVILTVWLQLQNATLTLQPGLRTAGLLLLQAIPLTLILFVLFPRVQGPLWGMPQDAYANSGLDDKMAPGSVSKLSLSDAVAFRVTFADQPPRREQMYWRGPVLWQFDGVTWTAGRPLGAKLPQLEQLGSGISYTVTLEPHNKNWLFALEMPMQISIPAKLTHDFQVHGETDVTSRLRYTAQSQLDFRANTAEHPRQLQRALDFPHQLNPRAQQMAAEWREQSPDDQAVVDAALAYFNRENFQYTLEPPPLGSHAVDDFLFTTRKGFCEHYASSFVILMRAAGVPARVVTGYMGGEYNSLGNYYIVRQSDAHAWAEVWLNGRGWLRIDPTAAIAPARVQSGMAAAVADSAALPFLARMQAPWLSTLRFNLDLWTNQWNQWVLGYNPERQFALLTRLGMENIGWQKMGFTMIGGVAILVGLFAFFLLRQLTRRDTDVTQLAYLKFCRRLAKAGIVRAPHEGPRDFAIRAARLKPHLAAAINDITAGYVALRYSRQPDRDALRAFSRKVTAFKL
jgi:transglutaminase-like putative cysteine protease